MFGGFLKSYVCKEVYILKMFELFDFVVVVLLLCVGIMVYLLLWYWNVGKGKKVGVVGFGGLGYMVIKMVKVMGVEVIVFIIL